MNGTEVATMALMGVRAEIARLKQLEHELEARSRKPRKRRGQPVPPALADTNTLQEALDIPLAKSGKPKYWAQTPEGRARMSRIQKGKKKQGRKKPDQLNG